MHICPNLQKGIGNRLLAVPFVSLSMHLVKQGLGETIFAGWCTVHSQTSLRMYWQSLQDVIILQLFHFSTTKTLQATFTLTNLSILVRLLSYQQLPGRRKPPLDTGEASCKHCHRHFSYTPHPSMLKQVLRCWWATLGNLDKKNTSKWRVAYLKHFCCILLPSNASPTLD